MTRRPVTFPFCPHCGLRLERVTLPTNHDRAAVTFLRCTSCGLEEGHEVETLPAEELA